MGMGSSDRRSVNGKRISRRGGAEARQNLGKERVEMVLEEVIVALQFFDCRSQGVLAREPPGDPPERQVYPVRGPVTPEPVLPGHSLYDQRYRVRYGNAAAPQVLIDPSDELVQPLGRVLVPARCQEVVVDHIDDDASIAPSRHAHEPPARAEYLVRVREAVSSAMPTDP